MELLQYCLFPNMQVLRVHIFFVDLRKSNSLFADNYTDINHPVRILSDAAQHLANKIPILQTRLLPGLSLFADGGSTVSRNARIQFS